MIGFAVTRIPDESWGSPKIARAITKGGDPWGELAILRGTPWEEFFREIPSSIFDMALRGHATPMMRMLGRPPEALSKKLPEANRLCRLRKECVNAASICVPGKEMPLCWEGEGIDPEAVPVASKIAIFWKEGIHVVIIVPDSART